MLEASRATDARGQRAHSTKRPVVITQRVHAHRPPQKKKGTTDRRVLRCRHAKRASRPSVVYVDVPCQHHPGAGKSQKRCCPGRSSSSVPISRGRHREGQRCKQHNLGLARARRLKKQPYMHTYIHTCVPALSRASSSSCPSPRGGPPPWWKARIPDSATKKG